MKGSGFVNALGLFTGVTFMLLGMVFLIGGSLITGTVDSILLESSAGLRTASEAIRTATDGVASSTGMVEDVRLSLESSSEVVASTGGVIRQTVSILEQMRIILPALANDMASMPLPVRNLMPANHFDEVAERTETVAEELGFLNSQLEALAVDVILTGESIGEVAVSVEAMEDDLLSAEGSFSDAAEKMETIAISIEDGSFAGIIAIFLAGFGVLMLLAGLYQISAGIMIRKLAKGQVTK